MRHRVLARLCVTVLAAVGIQGQTPARDTTVPAVTGASGTAAVSGVVVSDGPTSQPIRRATISLVSGDLRVPRSTVTDDAGRFTFADVATGNYVVTASKAAYVGTFFGSKQPGRGPGVPLAVRDGQRITNVILRMTKGSVIAGTLRLPGSQPAQGMTVLVAQIEAIGGVQRLRFTGGRATTDDRGSYRIYGLAAGDYLIQAQPSGLLSGALTGASDATQTTAAEVSWAEQVAQRRPGAIAPALAGGPARGPKVNYATVYFPGTADPSAARAISVGSGEERDGIDFGLQLVPTARVSGQVLGLDGRPIPNASVSLAARDDELNLASLVAPRPPVRSGSDGTFVVPAVAPGHYRLSARSQSAPANGAMAQGESLWAMQDVDIDGRDVADLALSMQPGMVVSGRMVFDAASLAPPAPSVVARARVALVPDVNGSAASDALASAGSAVAASVGPDGTFAVTGIVPGTYRLVFTVPGGRLSPSAPTGAWSLRSAMAGAVDLADHLLRIEPRQNIDGVVVTYTDRPTDLSGTLTDLANRAAPGYPIVVFSTDRADWVAGLRRVVASRPSSDGRFQLVGLPAGTYYLCAVVDLDDSALDDPTFLEQLVPSALTVTLAPGVPTVQNLRLAGGG